MENLIPQHPIENTNNKKSIQPRGLRVLTIAYGRANTFSAATKRILDIATVLAENGFVVKLLWFSPFHKMKKHNQFISLITRESRISLKIVPSLPLFAIRGLGGIGRRLCSFYIRMMSKKWVPDIIHAETATCACLAIRANLQIPIVVDFHGDVVAEKQMESQPNWKVMLAKKEVEEATSHAFGIITASNALKEFLINSYSASTRYWAVASCSVDISRFSIPPSMRVSMRQKLGIDDHYVLCYCGGTSVWQCIPETLSLFEKLRSQNPKIFFLFLTNGDTTAWNNLLARFCQEGSDYRIIGLEPTEVPDYLSSADVGLLLRKEHPVNIVSSPTKFGEYLAAGLPVISTRYAGDVPLIIEKTSCGFILDHPSPSNDDVIRISQFIDDVMIKRDVYAAMCKNAAFSYHDWGNASKEIIDLYSLIVKLKISP